MTGNSSSIDSITPRGKRPAAAVVSAPRGKRAAPEAREFVDKVEEDAPASAPVETPKARGRPPKAKVEAAPAAEKKTRAPRVARSVTGGFDLSSTIKSIKDQSRAVKLDKQAHDKTYKAESKRLQGELSRVSRELEALEKQNAAKTAGFEAAQGKIEKLLSGLQ